jgi:LacI family transcriptional regulator
LYNQDTAKESTSSLLNQTERPTAIFAANDLSAIAVIERAATLGLTVPGDLSVVGFDDIPEAARLSTPLTTIRQSMQKLGEEAVEMLLALMESKQPSEMHVRLPTALVRRATTAPPLG